VSDPIHYARPAGGSFKADTLRRAVMHYLLEKGGVVDRNVTDLLTKRLKANGIDCDTRTVGDALRYLAQEGFVEKVTEGKATTAAYLSSRVIVDFENPLLPKVEQPRVEATVSREVQRVQAEVVELEALPVKCVGMTQGGQPIFQMGGIVFKGVAL
jgi:Fe2+ or Zn2+ uptake regulation protein